MHFGLISGHGKRESRDYNLRLWFLVEDFTLEMRIVGILREWIMWGN